MDEMLAEFRPLAKRVRELADALFPAGARVCLRGVTSASWRGTVKSLDSASMRSLAADHVFVEWDNGNRYSVPIDEIEIHKPGDKNYDHNPRVA